MKKFIFTLFVLIVVDFSETQTLAQKDTSPYTVNSIIGDTLTSEERDYYKLFPQIQGFQSAVFYLNSDSTLNAEVYFYRDGQLTDTLIQNYKTLKSLNYHIYARDALENGLPNSSYDYQAPGYEKGAKVSVYLNNGIETSGELLSIRENSLLLFNPKCDERLLKPECINHIKAAEINKLVIEGNSNIFLGISLGLLASVFEGAIIYQSNYESTSFGPGNIEEVATSISIATICCLGIGAGIGLLTSTPDEVIEPFSDYDLRGLSLHSRYITNEPAELKKIK